MAGIGDLVTRLSMDNTDFVKGANQARGIVAGLSTSITAALGPVAASFAGAFALGSAVSGAREALAAEAKLTAVLVASGNAAGVSTEQIKAFAAQLQATTNFEDDATVAAAAMLASFGNIKGDQFTAVLASAADLATVMGTDLPSAVMLLGKALNNPTEGLSKLARSGVTFTESQTAMIKSLTESGNIMGAQQVVLGALEAKFKGAAVAVADPFKQLQNNVGDVGESLGAGLLPVLNSLASVTSTWLAPMNELLTSNAYAIDRITKIVIGATVAFVALKVAVIAYATYQRLATISAITFQAVVNPALLLKVAASIAVATATVMAMDAAMTGVANAAPGAIKGVNGMAEALGGTRGGVGNLEKVSDIMKEVARLKIQAATEGDANAAARMTFAEGGASEWELRQFDEAVAAHDKMIAKKEHLKRTQDEYNKSIQETTAKQFEWNRLVQDLDDEIAVLTGTMTKQEAARQGFMRQGFDEEQSTILAAKQAELEELKADGKAPASKSSGSSINTATAAAVKGSSAALSAIYAATRNQTPERQLKIAEQSLAEQRKQTAKLDKLASGGQSVVGMAIG